MKSNCFIAMLLFVEALNAQNSIYIPPSITGTNFNLDIQFGSKQFYPGITTNTMEVNGNFMGPTLILNKWDWVTMNVTNNLTGANNSTTLHWHGLNLPPEDIGGPHQTIGQGSTWSPSFQIRNMAATYFYRPLGIGKSQEQVSKGVIGFMIVKDSLESAITLPRTYGVDDFPLCIQSRSFDSNGQIEVESAMDTSISVNGTVNPVLNLPAQVVRLRLLNGSSRRSYMIALSGNMTFHMIASDASLTDSAYALTELPLHPGERAEILLDLQGLNGQTLFLKSNSSLLEPMIYGSDTLLGVSEIPGYYNNPLNGADFNIMQINVGSQIAGAVTTIPTSLVPYDPWPTPPLSYGHSFVLQPDTISSPLSHGIGPYNINNSHFNPNFITYTNYIHDIEFIQFTNQSFLAQTFHCTGFVFELHISNGAFPPGHLKGKKDVLLVMPVSAGRFVIKYENYGNDTIPYIYNSNMLRHEDQGLMANFIIYDTTITGIQEFTEKNDIRVYPNPVTEILFIQSKNQTVTEVQVIDLMGKIVLRDEFRDQNIQINMSGYRSGLYFISVTTQEGNTVQKILKE